MTPEQEQQVALIMRLRREYTDKALARRFQCSVKTLYRAWRRVLMAEVSQIGTPPTEKPPT